MSAALDPALEYERLTRETERLYAAWVAAIGLGAIANAQRAYLEAMQQRRRAYQAMGTKAPKPWQPAIVDDGERPVREGALPRSRPWL